MRTQKQIDALIEKYERLLEYYLWNEDNPHDYDWQFLVEDLTHRFPDNDILGVSRIAIILCVWIYTLCDTPHLR